MNDQGMEGARGQSARAGLALPGPLYTLAACGLVATASYLGAAWLRKPVIGMPAGVWVIGIAYAAGYARTLRIARRTAAPAQTSLALAPGIPYAAGWTGLDVGLFSGRLAALGWDACRSLLGGIGMTPARQADLESSLAATLDRTPAVARPLRIGVDAGPHMFAGLKAIPSPAGTPTEWVLVPPTREDQPTLARHRLDALVRHRPDGPTLISTPESGRSEAAWYDWSAPRPLSYASVFPTRIDPANITLDDIDPAERTEVELTAALARAAAALSRLPARLSVSDRLRGRTPVKPIHNSASAPANPIQSAMAELTRLIVSRPTAPPTAPRRAAARAVGAWLATTDSWFEPDLRRRGTDAAAMILADEPESLLRAAAVRLSAGDDAASFQAMDNAIRILRTRNADTVIDHVAFLQSELECGLPGPLTLGRVAAGVCLVCATTPATHIPYIRADFMDDARYSSWLVGRDQDRAALLQVFRHLEQSGDEIPSRAAA